jgi:hypothetical protein
MWTKDCPKVDGFYWFRGLKGTANGGGYNAPQVCEVYRSTTDDYYVMYVGTDITENANEPDHFGLFWDVPILPPAV